MLKVTIIAGLHECFKKLGLLKITLSFVFFVTNF